MADRRSGTRSWEDWCALADEYRRAHGDLLVPSRYVTPDGARLGGWIDRMRRRRSRLTCDQTARLESMGMVWSLVRPAPWDEWYALAVRYRERHGDIQIPAAYVAPEGKRLGAWMAHQKARYRGQARPPLTADQIRRLEALGVALDRDEARDRDWMRMLFYIVAFRAKNGRLPRETGEDAPDGRGMYGWIMTQRRAVRQGRLDRTRTQLLREAGLLSREGGSRGGRTDGSGTRVPEAVEMGGTGR